MHAPRLKPLLPFLKLMRFHQPIGIFLLLWPALWALWIAANGTPPLLILGVFLTGVILMRAAGCVINDIADRRFDQQVKRTKHRPLATGQLSLRAAVLLLIALIALAFALVLLLNPLTIKLALIAACLAILYPFAKRFTHWPQLILGIAFSWSIPMAFAATRQQIPAIAWYLLIANVLWTISYDTEYAMSDRNEDLKIGIKSTAILFGRYDRLIIGLMQLAMLGILIYIGLLLRISWPFYLSIGIAATLFISHQKSIQQRDPKACFQAFLKNSWVGLVIFLGILLSRQT
jgi:4-hydroxybenzoate polyprenyltransferase